MCGRSERRPLTQIGQNLSGPGGESLPRVANIEIGHHQSTARLKITKNNFTAALRAFMVVASKPKQRVNFIPQAWKDVLWWAIAANYLSPITGNCSEI